MEWTTADLATIAAVNGAVLGSWLVVWGVQRILQFFTAVVGR